ncbi:MAG: 2-succinyl-6-hydroxy-2,4-cyclohexadiene-1-carboxylate synthase [Bdellovibrionota bacterium]
MNAIAFQEWGSGKPLVLLHGFTGSSRNWSELAERLDKKYRVIAPDLPGHGRTELFPESFEATVDALEEWAGAQGIEGAHLAGYSMGGRLALGWAAKHPARWRSLTLEGASPGLRDPREQHERARADDKLAEEILQDGVETFVNRWEKNPLFASQASLPASRRETLRHLRLENTAEGLAWAARTLSPGRQPNYWNALKSLPMPVHFLAGELDEKYARIARLMSFEALRARVTLVQKAGHAVHFEQPGAYRAALESFLENATKRRLSNASSRTEIQA